MGVDWLITYKLWAKCWVSEVDNPKTVMTSRALTNILSISIDIDHQDIFHFGPMV